MSAKCFLWNLDEYLTSMYVKIDGVYKYAKGQSSGSSLSWPALSIQTLLIFVGEVSSVGIPKFAQIVNIWPNLSPQ